MKLIEGKMRGGFIESLRFLDFDEDEPFAVAADQIDFATLTAPTMGNDLIPTVSVVRRNGVFCGKAIVVVGKATKLGIVEGKVKRHGADYEGSELEKR